MFGLKELAIHQMQEVFSRHSSVQVVIIYGSRAMGTFRNNSDIDLTLVGNDITFSDLLKIENELDDLLLPYKIDLSIFNSIDNSDLADHINRNGKCFFKVEDFSIR